MVFLILKAVRAILFTYSASYNHHLSVLSIFIDVVTFFSLSACFSFSLSFFHEANYVFIVLFLAPPSALFVRFRRVLIFFYSYSVSPGCCSVFPTLAIFFHVAFRLVVMQKKTFQFFHFKSVSTDYSFRSPFQNVIYPYLFIIISFLSSSTTCSPVFGLVCLLSLS